MGKKTRGKKSRVTVQAPEYDSDDSRLYAGENMPDPNADDYTYDEVDQFHQNRDKVMLEKGKKVYDSDANSEVEYEDVFAGAGSGDSEYDSDPEIRQLQELQQHVALQAAGKAEFVSSSDDDDSDEKEDDDDDDDDIKYWAGCKGFLHGSNWDDYANADMDDEMNIQEEKACMNMQRKAANELRNVSKIPGIETKEQFFSLLLEQLPAEELIDKEDKQSAETSSIFTDKPTLGTLKIDRSKMTADEVKAELNKEYPELQSVLVEYNKYKEEMLTKWIPLQKRVEKEELKKGKFRTFVKNHYFLVNQYMLNMRMYFVLVKHGKRFTIDFEALKELMKLKKLVMSSEETAVEFQEIIDRCLVMIEEVNRQPKRRKNTSEESPAKKRRNTSEDSPDAKRRKVTNEEHKSIIIEKNKAEKEEPKKLKKEEAKKQKKEEAKKLKKEEAKKLKKEEAKKLKKAEAKKQKKEEAKKQKETEKNQMNEDNDTDESEDEESKAFKKNLPVLTKEDLELACKRLREMKKQEEKKKKKEAKLKKKAAKEAAALAGIPQVKIKKVFDKRIPENYGFDSFSLANNYGARQIAERRMDNVDKYPEKKRNEIMLISQQLYAKKRGLPEPRERKIHKISLYDKQQQKEAQEAAQYYGVEGQNEEEEYYGQQYDADGKRLITWEMEKNRGLTVKRKKTKRNPRVAYRQKHEKKEKNRQGAVRKVRTETTRYTGEASGIRCGVIRSVKFKY